MRKQDRNCKFSSESSDYPPFRNKMRESLKKNSEQEEWQCATSSQLSNPQLIDFTPVLPPHVTWEAWLDCPQDLRNKIGLCGRLRGAHCSDLGLRSRDLTRWVCAPLGWTQTSFILPFSWMTFDVWFILSSIFHPIFVLSKLHWVLDRVQRYTDIGTISLFV